MKRTVILLWSALLSFMCCFACIGYAQTSKDLTVRGEAQALPPLEVFITGVTGKEANGAGGTVNSFAGTVVNSTTNLGTNKDGTVTYTVTVYNNTGETYGYNAMIYTVGEYTYDNEAITVTPHIERRTEVEHGKYLSFDVTVAYKAGVSADTVLNSVIHYEFLPLDDIPEDEGAIAASGVLSQFERILNNKINEIPQSYQQLTDQMAAYQANDRYNESYIGNVVGASDADKALLLDLFQGQTHLNINGTDTHVTIMIKNEAVDGNNANGNEMVLYMTTDDLQKSSSWRTEYAPVYAAVFTKVTNADGKTEWIQKGDMYLGSCTIKQYSGYSGSGSFDTDTWRQLNASGNRTSTTIQNIIQRLD